MPTLTHPHARPEGRGGRSDVAASKKLAHSRPLFDPEIAGRAVKASFGKLNPLTLMKNPVMFVVEVGRH